MLTHQCNRKVALQYEAIIRQVFHSSQLTDEVQKGSLTECEVIFYTHKKRNILNKNNKCLSLATQKPLPHALQLESLKVFVVVVIDSLIFQNNTNN